jgi:ABC-type transport system involved in cytochrome c biogenesis permease component
MKTPNAFAQFRILLANGIKSELSDLERLISPLLFALTILILFTFAVGEIEPDMRIKLFVAEIFLTTFLALQISFSRVFEPARTDKVFDLLRTYPVSYNAWFLAKYVLVLLLGLSVAIPTIFIATLMAGKVLTGISIWGLIPVTILAVAGLSALGVLLAAITLKAQSRQILYPLLYFPLTAPVLLSAIQLSLTYLEKGSFTSETQSWFLLLAAFDVIYVTLGVLLFSELVDDSQ